MFTSSLEEFLDAAQAAGLRERVHAVQRGETFPLDRRLPHDAS